MKYLLYVILMLVTSSTYAQIKDGRYQLFDSGWKFLKSDINAQKTDFNDADWRQLDLPHDWSIEDLAETDTDSTIGPFYKNAIGKNATAFTVGGTAWYRKHFKLDATTKGKVVSIQFDGVYMNSDIWINGNHLGNHPNGYISFEHDLTPFLNAAGEDNVIAVEVKNEGDNSRWYSGSGIYRHVWLSVLEPVHVSNWGVKIVTENITGVNAEVHVKTDVSNISKNTSILTEIYSPQGVLLLSNKSKVLNEGKFNQTFNLSNPQLWSPVSPYLYNAKIMLFEKGKKVDEYSQNFGVRSISFNATTGFVLNGQTVKLKGTCVHHDNGPLGAAAYDAAEIRKVTLLKKNGYNAVRLAHNPYSPAFMDACDRLGLLVINEAFDMWLQPKTEDDYGNYFKEHGVNDLQSLIKRDFNHPSVIMWSIGNEIPEIIDSSGYETSKILAAAVRELDSTRAVTNALAFHVHLLARKKWETNYPSAEVLDVVGYNYNDTQQKKDHKIFPEWVTMATEYFPPKALENWDAVEENSHVIGSFSWAGIDYLGEAGLGLARERKEDEKLGGFQEAFMGPEWPIFNSYTGELDLIGNKKSASYYLDVVRRISPLEMVVHKPLEKGTREYPGFYGFPNELKSWTWPGPEGDTLEVRVFSRGDRVKLLLNGKELGEQSLSSSSITTSFKVPFTSGKLEAKSFLGDELIASETLATAGKPAALRLTPDKPTLKADNQDLTYILVEVIDKEGNLVPKVDDLLVNFEIEGKTSLAGVGNGSPRDMSSFQKPEKKVFQGKCLLIVKSANMADEITITASAKGLKSRSISIESKHLTK